MNLRQKIKNTKLFSNLEKIEILSSFDEFKPETLTQLEKTVDDYDESLILLKEQFSKEVSSELDELILQTDNQQKKDSLIKVKTGYSKLLSVKTNIA